MRYAMQRTYRPHLSHNAGVWSLFLIAGLVGMYILSSYAEAQTATSTTISETSTTTPVDAEAFATTTPDGMDLPAQAATDRTERLDTVEELRQQLAETVTEQPAVLPDRTRIRITNLAANMSNRSDAAINRLDIIADRLDRRATKLAATGQPTDSARAATAAARTELSSAREILADIDVQVYRFVTAQNPHEAWPVVDTIYQSAHEAISSARVALRIALNELQNPPTINNPPTATTTQDAAE